LAGDGTTTSIVLAQAIVQEGLKSDKNRIQLRKEINEDCAKVIDELKKIARPVASFEEVKKVATISAESEEIGDLIATAVDKVGKEGQITVTESEISGIRVEYTQGLDIDEGMIHPYMMNTEKATAVIENPKILIVDTKLSNIKDILPIVEKVGQSGVNQIVVICDGMDGNMVPTIIKNKQGFEVTNPQTGQKVWQQFEILGIKFPAVRKQEFIEDIALMTGAKVMGVSTGLFPDKATLEDLGTCDKLVATLKNTTFVGCNGNVEDKITQIRNERDASEINKADYDARIARLT
jgi:chaperonin GroEL